MKAQLNNLGIFFSLTMDELHLKNPHVQHILGTSGIWKVFTIYIHMYVHMYLFMSIY